MRQVIVDGGSFMDLRVSVGDNLVYIEQGDGLFCMYHDAALELGRVLTSNVPASVDTLPKGQDGEAGLVRSKGGAVDGGEADSETPNTTASPEGNSHE